MVVHEIHDLSNQRVIALLKKSLSQIDEESYISNYHPDYENTPGNLFNTLKIGRYRIGHGKYYIIEEDGKYIGSAGWNEYDLNKDIALLLTRMYTEPNYRMNYHIANNILPLALAESKRHKHLFEGMNIARKELDIEHEQESTLLDEKNIKDV